MSSASGQVHPETLLTSQEAARYLGVSRVTVSNWVEQGKVTSFRTAGGHIRIPASGIVDLMDRLGQSVPSALETARRSRVLVIDDTGVTMREAVTNVGVAEVAFVDDPVDALLDLVEFRPNVVLVNASLRSMDANHLCAALRARRETKYAQVVLYGFEDQVESTLAPPVDLETLRDS